MGLTIKLSGEKSRKIFLLFFLLASLLPFLFLVFIIYHFVLPHLSPEQILKLRPTFTYGLLVLLIMPLISFFIISNWISRLEHLTSEIRTKARQVMTEKSLIDGCIGSISESELLELETVFSNLLSELQEKMVQLNEHSQKMLSINHRISKLAITDDLITTVVISMPGLLKKSTAISVMDTGSRC